MQPTFVFVAALAMTMATPAAAAMDLCARGRHQSPIDIRATQRAALPTLQAEYRSAALRVVNDGHTVRLRIANGSRLMAGREALTLQQLHFHLPGGDRVQGEDFPMAMHFVHKSPAGQLVTLVVPFRLGQAHAALAALLPHLPARGVPEATVPGVSVDASRLLPATLGYYAYDGSLTSAPCTEGVRWLVLKQPQTLSAAQRDALLALFPPNARAVQPLNGRVVRESL
jgi:carbonic anhydrase